VVTTHGRRRWPEVVVAVGGHRWPANWPKSAHAHPLRGGGKQSMGVAVGVLEGF